MPEPLTSRRSTPYPGCGASVDVPTEIWKRSLEVLRQYGDQSSEGLVYWGGVVTAGHLQVTALYVPGHSAQGARVRLTPEESRWLVRRLRARDEKLIAQVHSHPGAAYHSPGDDERATSFHRGFYSIVVPNYARAAHDPADCAVFEFDGTNFCQLKLDESRRRLHFIPLVEERLPRQEKLERRTWISSIVSKLKRRLIAPKKQSSR